MSHTHENTCFLRFSASALCAPAYHLPLQFAAVAHVEVVVGERAELEPQGEVAQRTYQADEAEYVHFRPTRTEAMQCGQHTQQDARQKQHDAVVLQRQGAAAVPARAGPVAMPVQALQASAVGQEEQQPVQRDEENEGEQEAGEDEASPELADVVPDAVGREFFPYVRVESRPGEEEEQIG